MIDEIAKERANRRKSARTSIIIHAALAALAFFVTCSPSDPADLQYAVAINFEEIVPPPPLEEFKESSQSNKAQEKEGKARENADRPAEIKNQQTKTVEVKRPEVKLPKPTPTPPTPTDPVVTETTMEDETEVTAAEEVMEIEELEPEPVPDPVPEPEVVEPEPEPEPEKAREDIKTKLGKLLKEIKTGGSDDQGNPDGDPSRSDGTDGTGEGKEGDGGGYHEKGDDGDSGTGSGGGGTGEYDGSGNGVFGRRIVKNNIAGVLRVGFGNQTGMIVAKFCVDQKGRVTYAELLDFETTATIPPSKEKDVLRAIYEYTLEPKLNAPDEQCGKLKINLQINAFGG